MNIDLSGERVIVTDASRGIGLSIARAFAAEGAGSLFSPAMSKRVIS